MKVRQTIVNEYEAVQYLSNMATGWAYLDELVRFAGKKPSLFRKKGNETIEEALKRIKSENSYLRPRFLKKYYEHENGRIIINPRHKAIYIFEGDEINEIRKSYLKLQGYEIIEEDIGK
ncbi:hypothetical protein [Listeria newyorkensis]|uniref:hypothetical protein n=1 Tax=Listeria newyorkensis TaxID=1497681 RepID=UPI00051E0D04|nr:hypothetical protein [Listeria newyorkensis]KGL44107.1 hypothetical protein EP58_06565 [Listeria newyorkensis]SQC57487.1 Uncharacterised protein [Listeria newyorkensis]